MNSMELKQALLLIKEYIEEPEYKTYSKYDELAESINKMRAFFEHKLESNTPFTSDDLSSTLEFFGNIRGHINAIEGKKEELVPAKTQVIEATNASDIPFHFVKDILSKIEYTIASIDCTKNFTLDQSIGNISGNDVVFDREPDYRGSMSSKRIMISLKFEHGEPVKGYFTAEKSVFDLDRNHKYENMLRAALIDRKYKYDSFVQSFTKNVLNSENGVSDLLMAMAVIDSSYDKGNPKLFEGYDKTRLGAFFEPDKDTLIEQISVHPAFKELLINMRNEVTDSEMSEFIRVWFQFRYSIKAESGSVIAGRNVAMSNVANMLGIPHIVAKSVPATVTWNGRTIKGVFTENIEGNITSIDGKSDELKYTDAMTVSGVTPQYMMDLADLQILDYICGNVDRHQSNFAFTVKDGKLAGVKGFDNDFSFGSYIPDDNTTVANGIPLDGITVITGHMAKTLLNLYDDTLRSALSGTGLKEKEIEACVERKNRVQSRVRNNDSTKYMVGKIMTLNDELWANASILDFADIKVNGQENENIFGYADIIKDDISKLQKAYMTNKPIDKETEKAQNKADAAALSKKNPENQAHKSAELDAKSKNFIVGKRRNVICDEAFREKLAVIYAFAKELKNVSTIWSLNNKPYNEFLESLNSAEKFENKQIADYKVCLEFDDYLKELDKESDEYIIYKKSKGKLNKVGKKRLEIAEKIKAYVSEEKTVFHEASCEYNEKKNEGK